MKNKAIILLIIVVAGFLAALYLMGYLPFGNEPEELNINDISIKSNDETAELFIPKGALPGSVDLNDISITKVSNSQTENGTWIVYNLEPDGLEFTEEVLFNVTLESVNNTLPIVFISSSNGVDLVNNTFINNNLENSTQTVSIPLTHFSEIRLYGPDAGAFSLDFDIPKYLWGAHGWTLSADVGEKINTVASFTFITNKLTFGVTGTGREIWVYQFLDPYVRYKGSWINAPSDDPEVENIITPVGTFGGKPSSTKVGFKQTNTVEDDTFTFDAEGQSHLDYKAEVTASVKLTHYKSKSDYKDGKVYSSATYRNQKFVIETKMWVSAYNPTLIVQGIYTTKHVNNPEIHMVVKIVGPANATGFVTLTGSNMEPMIQPVLIGPDGSTRNTFIHPFSGEITVSVEVVNVYDVRYIAERKHMID